MTVPKAPKLKAMLHPDSSHYQNYPSESQVKETLELVKELKVSLKTLYNQSDLTSTTQAFYDL
jgi:hypothetical protein